MFLNLWQRAHVDTLTDSTSAFRALRDAILAEAEAEPNNGGHSEEEVQARAAASIRLEHARAAARNPELMNVFRLMLTLFSTRVISFISEDGYEVQLLQQPGACWGGDWAFVTTWRHGARPLGRLAASIILCFRCRHARQRVTGGVAASRRVAAGGGKAAVGDLGGGCQCSRGAAAGGTPARRARHACGRVHAPQQRQLHAGSGSTK